VRVREDGKEGGADTELKTKTPHVNVGNNNGMNYGRVRKPECVRPKENESE